MQTFAQSFTQMLNSKMYTKFYYVKKYAVWTKTTLTPISQHLSITNWLQANCPDSLNLSRFEPTGLAYLDYHFWGAMPVAAPRSWNADIRCAPSLDTFNKRLKSYLFSAAYELYQLFFLS